MVQLDKRPAQALNGARIAQRQRTTVPPRPTLPRRAVAASLLLGLLAPIPAHAHAILEESVPAQDGTVATGHIGISLRYNSRIDKGRSRLVLTGPDHDRTPLAIMQAGPPDILTTSTDLKPGAYTIRWNVLATDGHLTRGDVRFTVTEP
jgi:methionine-rich copper-binding protein CopC